MPRIPAPLTVDPERVEADFAFYSMRSARCWRSSARVWGLSGDRPRRSAGCCSQAFVRTSCRALT